MPSMTLEAENEERAMEAFSRRQFLEIQREVTAILCGQNVLLRHLEQDPEDASYALTQRALLALWQKFGHRAEDTSATSALNNHELVFVHEFIYSHSK